LKCVLFRGRNVHVGLYFGPYHGHVFQLQNRCKINDWRRNKKLEAPGNGRMRANAYGGQFN